MAYFSIAIDPEFSKPPHMESIYNLLPRPVIQKVKPRQYRSKHDPLQPVSNSQLKENGPNFGNQAKSIVDPKKFLKKKIFL